MERRPPYRISYGTDRYKTAGTLAEAIGGAVMYATLLLGWRGRWVIVVDEWSVGTEQFRIVVEDGQLVDLVLPSAEAELAVRVWRAG
jgi:hypothetical protein